MKLSLSLKLLTTLAVLTTMASPAMAQDMSKRDRHQAEKQAKRDQRQAFNQNAQNIRQAQQNTRQDFRQAQRAQQSAFEQNRRAANELAKQQDRARELAQRNQVRLQQDARRDDRRDDRFDNRWTSNRHDNDRDNRWDNNGRWHNNRQILSYNKAFRNWDAQRDYLKANIRRLNQERALSQLQQQQLNAQMQAAYLAYHNNNWNGGYNWDYYSEPQFLDYLQVNQPSLLDRILGYLGVGTGGLGTGNYLYSDNWLSERDQLSRNMARIHQLALEGRITPYQEQQLLANLRTEFSLYKNNNWNGGYGWSQYSEPGFIDYLNSNRPSLLTTIRSYLR